MSKKISLTVNGVCFDIDVDDQFAPYLQFQMAKDFNINGNTEIKLLLQAYVRKNYELFKQDSELKALVDQIDNH